MTTKCSISTAIILVFALSSCVTTRYRPCTNGGQPARENPSEFKGFKTCTQVRGDHGENLNDGKYFEYYNNEKLALQGEYDKGKKTGRWIEYDPDGKKIGDKYFKDGKENPRP